MTLDDLIPLLLAGKPEKDSSNVIPLPTDARARYERLMRELSDRLDAGDLHGATQVNLEVRRLHWKVFPRG